MKNRRLDREYKTIAVMISMFCHDRQHGPNCLSCRELQIYARKRLESCPFREGKTTCAKCPVHCYQPEMREKVREVMRYSGPRMMRRHPWLAALHLIDNLRKKPTPPQKN